MENVGRFLIDEPKFFEMPKHSILLGGTLQGEEPSLDPY